MKKLLAFLFSIFLASSVMAQPITYGTQVSDTAFSSSWNGILDIAPSKNAVYDQVQIVKSIGVWDGDYATYQLANTAAVAAGKTLFITLPWTLTANTTLTANVHVVKGGSFTKASTYTLAFSGGFQNPSNSQSFIGFSAGDVTFGARVDAHSEWWGSALTHVPIQNMLSSFNATLGGTAHIGLGTFVIGAGLYNYGTSNLEIIGEGIDNTILIGTVGVMTIPALAIRNAESWGVLSIDAAKGYPNVIKNTLVKKLTVKLVGGTPGTFGDDVANGTYYIKTLYFGWTENIHFDRIKIEGSRWEALYHDGTEASAMSFTKVTNSRFLNTQHNAFNINNRYAHDIIYTENYFESCAYAIQMMGRRIVVANNVLKNCNNGIIIAESSYPNTTVDQESVIVTGNVISGLGSNAIATSNVYGISVNGGDSQFTDGTVSNGIVVSNNLVHNSVKLNTNVGPITAFKIAGGNAKVSNNHVSGLKIEAGATGYCIAYDLNSGPVDGANKQQIYLSNNTLDNLLNTTPAYGSLWTRGISIAGRTGSDYYLSGNVITGIDPTTYALYVLPLSGTPIIYLNGDILNGYILYASPGKWEQPGPTVLNYSGELNNKPLFGSSNGSITTSISRGVTFHTFTDLDTTPSVAGYNFFVCTNSVGTTITTFHDAIVGQVITILFTDSNTTIAETGDIKLSAAFTSSADDMITLLWTGSWGNGWCELSRSVN